MAQRCTHCGREINAPHRRTFESSHRTPLRQSVAPPMYPPLLPGITQPTGLPNMESHVHVPVNQAIISGCLSAPVVSLVVFSAAIYIYKIPTGEALLMSFIGGGITYFIIAARKWNIKTAFYDSLLMVETALDIDLDGDGDIGQTAIKTEVRVNNNWVYADLPHDRGNEKALVDFLAAVLQGVVTFSERGAISSGYNVDRFKELRKVFIDSGFAYRKGKADNSPVVFTVAGNAVLRDIVNKPPPENYEGEDSRGMSAHYVERGSKRESWG